MSSFNTGLVRSVVLWIEQFRKSWTTQNSWEITIWSLELSGSSSFGRVEPPWTLAKLHHRSCSLCFAMVQTGSKELNRSELMRNSYDPYSLWNSVVRGGLVGFKLPWTHAKHHRRPGFGCCTMVRTGLKEMSHTRLMRNYLMILDPSGAQGSEEVWKDWITQNACQASIQVWFAMLCYGSNSFGRVEPNWTHEKLSYDPCSLWNSVFWGGSVGLNNPKLFLISTIGLFPIVVQSFELDRKSWTTPNTWKITLWFLFSLERSGSRRHGRVSFVSKTRSPWSYTNGRHSIIMNSSNR